MRRKKNTQEETKLKKMLFDRGVGREDTQTVKQKAIRDDDEFKVFKCRSADDMLSALNSISEEVLYDNK